MESSTISKKYQVVIPKAIRKGLNLRPGQKLKVTKTKDGSIVLSTRSSLDKFVGSVQGVWGDDPAEYISKQRDEWEEHQQELDKLWTKK